MDIIVGHMVVGPKGRVGMVMWQTPKRTVSYIQYVNNGAQHSYLTSELRLALTTDIDAAGLSGVGRLPAPDEEG